jgi:hypothetical protein
VLLANLRRIKAANAADHNHVLNQAGDAAGNPNSWFGKTQDQINAAITTMSPDQIKLFQQYQAASTAVTAGNTDPEKVAMHAAVTRANHGDFNTAGGDGLFTKVLNKANALDLNSFRALRFKGNRIDRD